MDRRAVAASPVDVRDSARLSRPERSYVVAYIKIVDSPTKQYLYGHEATPDLATATQWCQTGTGFAPAMCTVKSGVLYEKNVRSGGT